MADNSGLPTDMTGAVLRSMKLRRPWHALRPPVRGGICDDAGIVIGRQSGASSAFLLTTVIALALSLWPVISYPLPPLADYANHLARMHIISALPHDAVLARYYTVEWQIIPNLAMDLVVPPLAKVFGVYPAGQMFTALTFLVIATGTFALSRVLSARWSIAPLFALPFLYNQMLLIGGLNYLLGIGLSLWALAAWIALDGRSVVLRLAVAALLGVGLFFSHLYAVGLFGVGLLAYETRRLWLGNGLWGPRLAHFCSPALAFLPLLGLLLVSRTAGLSGNYYWDFAGKFESLGLGVIAYSTSVALALVAVMAAGAVWAFWRGYLTVHPLAGYLLVISAIVFLAMPRLLFDTYMADQRLPMAIMFMLIACLDLRLPERAALAGMALAVILIGVRVLEVRWQWQTSAVETAEVQRAFSHLKRGARLLTITADSKRGYVPADYGLDHAASLASIERSALTTRTFVVAGKQILAMTQRYRDFVDQFDGAPPDIDMLVRDKTSNASGQYSYWHHWPERFDNVLVIFTPQAFTNPDPSGLEEVFAGRRFRLYACKKGTK
ncbi:MAG: hypothetical protein R3D67_01885 [Hyphomicrobiaceae bacterium]